MKIIKTDCVVIGCGIAGSICALELANSGINVVLITNSDEPDETTTRYAQGGIVYPPREIEGRERFVADILEVGAGLCYEPAVRFLTEKGAEIVDKFLVEYLQIPFDRETGGKLDFTIEAGHPEVGHPEIEHPSELIIHVEDKTGLSIQEKLIDALLKHPNIDLLTCMTALDLLNLSYHTKELNNLYKKPQCIGAYIYDQKSKEFMSRYDYRKELASHDIVSRAIHQEMLSLGDPYVFLDISHKPDQWIRTRFPYTYSQCLSYGVDITKEPIPVVPAAHYSCGGVWVDLKGETSIPGLFAVGEVACSGV